MLNGLKLLRSSLLAEKINKCGLENLQVFNLEGSIFKWANENKPLEGSDFVHPFRFCNNVHQFRDGDMKTEIICLY